MTSRASIHSGPVPVPVSIPAHTPYSATGLRQDAQNERHRPAPVPTLPARSHQPYHPRHHGRTQSNSLSLHTEPGTVKPVLTHQDLRHLKWSVYKDLGRWTALSICVAVLAGETFLAIFNGADFDTYLAIPWVVLVGAWNARQAFLLRKTRGHERVSAWFLAVEGAALVTGVPVCIFVWKFTNAVYTRGPLLTTALTVVMMLHFVFMTRAAFEKRQGLDRMEDGEFELPVYRTSTSTSGSQRPAQVVVQYVHNCPSCGNRAEPLPEEAVNVELAMRGELQPQGVIPDRLGHVH